MYYVREILKRSDPNSENSNIFCFLFVAILIIIAVFSAIFGSILLITTLQWWSILILVPIWLAMPIIAIQYQDRKTK